MTMTTMNRTSLFDLDVLAPAPEVLKRRVLDIDMRRVPAYTPGKNGATSSTFAQEDTLLTKILVAKGDIEPPTEQEVIIFAELRYRQWYQTKWIEEQGQ